MIGRETEVLGENLLSAALSTTKPTCCPEANPGRRGGKSASNRLSYGTAMPEEKVKQVTVLSLRLYERAS
jgi:hypothetical protein